VNGAPLDPRPPLARLTPEDLPRLAIFLDSYLRADGERPSRTLHEAAWEYVAEAELDELQDLARDWEVLVAAAREAPLAEVNRALGQRFGGPWQAASQAEIEAVAAEFERALRE
jgi:hypothetical protein